MIILILVIVIGVILFIWLLPAGIMATAALIAVIVGIFRAIFPQRIKAQHAARNRIPLVERMRADSERMKRERLAKKAARRAKKGRT